MRVLVSTVAIHRVAPLIVCVLAGCANPINDQTWSKYIAGGHAQSASGDWVGAEEAYRRAVINAQVARLGAEKEAYALHNLALVERNLCKLDEADDVFQRALQLRSNNRDTTPMNLSVTIFEFAQLRYERGRYEESALLMERGFPIGEKRCRAEISCPVRADPPGVCRFPTADGPCRRCSCRPGAREPAPCYAGARSRTLGERAAFQSPCVSVNERASGV
jgi:hypothetical protein